MTETEKYVLDYFGMKDQDATENTVIKTDYGQLVNIITMWDERFQIHNQKEVYESCMSRIRQLEEMYLNARALLKESTEAIDWAQTNLKPVEDAHYSDFFNILTNAKEAAEQFLNNQPKSQEADGIEKTKTGEINVE